jgi:hypothetical protein
VDVVNPVIALVKAPVPVPFVVQELDVVGPWLVDQQTPRAVTVAPPSELTAPPLVAVVWAISRIKAVLTVGALMFCPLVTKLIWAPYPVPALFVA